jgi:hypothetical protein
VPADERISFVWVGIPGFLITFIVLALVSFFDPRKQTALKGLTIQTVDRTRL